jgi:DNA topoisomerase-3
MRHNEATLLGAMESAGREIEDEALRAAMKETGLGTPATRAATIETLLKRGFIAREGKQVVATQAGIALIEGLPVPTLASPELTGAWEARLVRIARGQDTRAAFMTDIVRYVHEIMAAIRHAPFTPGAARTPADGPSEPRHRPETTRPARAAKARGSESPGDPSDAIRPAPIVQSDLPCPRCQRGHLVTGNRGWGCSRWRDGCAFVIWFAARGKRITESQLRDLVRKGRTRKAKWTGPGKTSETGRLILDLAATHQHGAARFLSE